jgi:ribosome-associated heat shock protein Hsp15
VNEQGPSRRIDQRPWYTLFYKSQSVANAYCAKRRVRLNSWAVKKAGQPIRIGDVLTLPTRGDIAVVRVAGLGARRGPASEAATFYEHIEMSAKQSEQPAHKR